MKTLPSYLFLLLLFCYISLPIKAGNLQDWQSNSNKSLSSLTTPIRIINLWATWCKPCRKEMSVMSAWYQQQNQSHIALIGIALDNKNNINQFLTQTPVSYPIWIYNGNDSRAWMKSLGNHVGTLPFTLVEAPQCGYRQTIFGEVTAQKLNESIKMLHQKCQLMPVKVSLNRLLAVFCL